MLRKTLILLMLSAALFAGGGGHGHAEEQPKLSRAAQKALHQAYKALEKGQFAQVVTDLEAYLQDAAAQEEPIPVDAFLMLGNAHHNLDAVRSAATVFARGVEMYPEDAPLRLNLAITRYEVGDVAKGAKDFRDAFRLYRAAGEIKPELLYHAAVCHYQAEQLKAARKDMQEFWALKPTPVKNAWTGFWVQLLCALEDWSAAEKAIALHLATNRGDADFWKLLGQVRASANRYAKAATAFEVAHSLKPLSSNELRMLADIYFYLDAPLSGIPFLLEATGGNPSAKDHDELAQAYARALRPDEAISHARKALHAKPTSKRALALGQFMFEAGQHRELLELVRQQGRNDARNGELLLLAALSNLELGQLDTASSLLDRAARVEAVANQAKAWRRILEELDEARREAQTSRIESDGTEAPRPVG